MHKQALPDELTAKAFLGLAVVAIVLILPVGLTNMITGTGGRGIAASGVSLLLLVTAFRMHRNQRYQPNVTLFSLLPLVGYALISGTHNTGIVGLMWAFSAILAFYVLLPENTAWAANLAVLGLSIPLAFRTAVPHLAYRTTVALVLCSLVAAIFLRVITLQQGRLRDIAVTDRLTGTYNRTLMEMFLADAVKRSVRTGARMSLLAIDVDHFKTVNDTWGHAVGDEVLREMAAVIQSRLRATDRVIRTGGEEFLVLLHDTGGSDAVRIGNELTRQVRMSSELHRRGVTISAGVAELEAGEPIEAWMRRSDDRLYESKREGRDRVTM